MNELKISLTGKMRLGKGSQHFFTSKTMIRMSGTGLNPNGYESFCFSAEKGFYHQFTSKNEIAFIGHSGLVLLPAPPEGSFDVELPF